MDKFIVTYGLDTGGSERVAVTLANAWAQRGEQVTIISLSEEQSHYDLDPRITLVQLGLASSSRGPISAAFNNIKRVRQIRKLIHLERPTWVIGIATTMNVLSAIANIGLKNFVIATEHIYPPASPTGKLWSRLRRHTYRLATCATAPTELTAQWLRIHTRAQHVHAIPNPIRFPMPVLRPTLNPSDYLGQNKKLVLAVGRLATQKGFDLLIDAFSQVASEQKEWQLIIVGEGPERPDLSRLIAQHGLGGRVLMPGRAGNISHWYERADLFVMSSRYEGFGYSLAEAMAYGCASISFDCDSGPGTIISSGSEGVLVSPNDVPALAKAMIRVMAQDSVRLNLAASGKSRAKVYFEENVLLRWDNLFSQYEETLSDVTRA